MHLYLVSDVMDIAFSIPFVINSVFILLVFAVVLLVKLISFASGTVNLCTQPTGSKRMENALQ